MDDDPEAPPFVGAFDSFPVAANEVAGHRAAEEEVSTSKAEEEACSMEAAYPEVERGEEADLRLTEVEVILIVQLGVDLRLLPVKELVEEHQRIDDGVCRLGTEDSEQPIIVPRLNRDVHLSHLFCTRKTQTRVGCINADRSWRRWPHQKLRSWRNL